MFYTRAPKAEDVVSYMRESGAYNKIGYEVTTAGVVASILAGGSPGIAEGIKTIRGMSDDDNTAIRLANTDSPALIAGKQLGNLKTQIEFAHNLRKKIKASGEKIENGDAVKLAVDSLKVMADIMPETLRHDYFAMPPGEYPKNFDGYNAGPNDENEDEEDEESSTDQILRMMLNASYKTGSGKTMSQKEMLEKLAEVAAQEFVAYKRGEDGGDGDGNITVDGDNDGEGGDGSTALSFTDKVRKIVLEDYLDISGILHNAMMLNVPQMSLARSKDVQRDPSGRNVGSEQLNLASNPALWDSVALGTLAAAPDVFAISLEDFSQRYRYNARFIERGQAYYVLVDTSASMYPDFSSESRIQRRLSKAIAVAVAVAQKAKETKSTISVSLFTESYIRVTGMMNAILKFGLGRVNEVVMMRANIMYCGGLDGVQSYVDSLHGPKQYIAKAIAHDIFGLYPEFAGIPSNMYEMRDFARALVLCVTYLGYGNTKIDNAIYNALRDIESLRTEKTDVVHLVIATDDDSSGNSVRLSPDVRLHLFSVAENEGLSAVARNSGGAVINLVSMADVNAIADAIRKDNARRNGNGKDTKKRR